MSLRDRVAAETDEQGWPAATTPGASAVPADPPPAPPAAEPDEELPHIEYTAAIAAVERVPVHVAWARVMCDVQSIAKDENATIRTQGRDGGQGGSYSFRYRGIDKVLNAVGPALRRHGVLVIPTKSEATYGSAGKMRECTVTVTYRVFGPDGSYFDAQACGEGLDAGERATAKALTTAYRNWLVTALTIPTQDPKMDPDRVDLRRDEQVMPKPTDYRDEVTDPRTSLGRLKQIRAELTQHRLGAAQVVNEVGDEESLLDLVNRIGRQRQAEAG